MEVLKAQKVPNQTENRTLFYYLSKEEVENLKIEAPKDVILKPLSLDNATQIYDIWSYKNEDSIEYIKTLIEYNPTVGVYSKSNELMAWCFRLETGDLALLQVEEKHFRKGFGTLATVELCRVFACLGYDCAATILPHNLKSQSLFGKLGFNRIYDTYWIWTGPPPT